MALTFVLDNVETTIFPGSVSEHVCNSFGTILFLLREINDKNKLYSVRICRIYENCQKWLTFPLIYQHVLYLNSYISTQVTGILYIIYVVMSAHMLVKL